MTVRPAFTLGILGSGQLGRMIAIAAAELGIPSHIYAPDASTSPAGQVAAHAHTAEYQDAEALAEFAAGVEAVVCEFENVPASALAILAELVPVSPGAIALQTAQSRQAEKTLARELGIAVPDFWPVASAAELADALVVLDGPGILKTDRMGYDGKGQIRLDNRAAAGEIWQQMGGVPCVLERLVDFSAEISFWSPVMRQASSAISRPVRTAIRTVFSPVRLPRQIVLKPCWQKAGKPFRGWLRPCSWLGCWRWKVLLPRPASCCSMR